MGYLQRCQEFQNLARGGFFYYRIQKELIGLRPAGEKTGRLLLAHRLRN